MNLPLNVSLDPNREFVPLSIAVLSISDTRPLADDRSGALLADRLTKAGHHLAQRALVPDSFDLIQREVCGWIADPSIDCILTTGGTGFAARDVTPEAITPLLTKKMDGFSVLFHHLSFQKIGTSTLQSRALAGLAEKTFIFVLPGSPSACKDAWDEILVFQLDYRSRPCNLVEILLSLKNSP